MPEPRPVILSRCVIEIDLDEKALPEVKCWRDRERTVNPDLQKGMTCESRIDVFDLGRKRVHVFDVICRPEKVFRKLQHAPADKVIRQMREMMQNQGIWPQASHTPCPATKESLPKSPANSKKTIDLSRIGPKDIIAI